jgi:hypothetical protein
VPNFDRSMSRAPRDDRELLLLVCTGEDETPITREVGWYDHELKRWEGDWRYYDGPNGYAQAEPIGWAELPEIDQSFLDALKAKAKMPTLKGPDPKGAAQDEFDAIGAKLAGALAEHATGKAGKRAATKAEKRATTEPKIDADARKKTETFDPL